LLYACPNIACRRCHNLAFASENETQAGRSLRRLLKQRDRLGQAEGGVVAPFPSKPRWWRWPRYLRARRKAMQREREYWRDFHAAMVNGKYLPKGRKSGNAINEDQDRR